MNSKKARKCRGPLSTCREFPHHIHVCSYFCFVFYWWRKKNAAAVQGRRHKLWPTLNFRFLLFHLLHFIVTITGQVIAILDSSVSFSPALTLVESRQRQFPWLGISVWRDKVSNGGCILACVRKASYDPFHLKAALLHLASPAPFRFKWGEPLPTTTPFLADFTKYCKTLCSRAPNIRGIHGFKYSQSLKTRECFYWESP